MKRSALLIVPLLMFLATAAIGAAVEEKPAKENGGPGGRMDYGPVIHYFLTSPADKKDIAYKGISIKLGDGGICFDAETMRFVAGWSGGFVDMSHTTPAVSGQGAGMATVKGKALFGTKPGPGWADKGIFKDPRANGIGNLPQEWAKYRGLYRHGDQAVLSYTVGDTTIRELPGAIPGDGGPVFTRTIEVGKGPGQILLVCEVDGATGGVGPHSATPGSARSGGAEGSLAVLNGSVEDKEALTAVGVANAPKGATLEVADGRIELKLPALSAPARLVVAVWSGAKTGLGGFGKAVQNLPPPVDLDGLCKGGAARWEAITTAGKIGSEDGPYVVDSLVLPQRNPFGSWLRPTGLDFFPDGRAAVCTFEGEVWLVSGIDDSLGKVTWKRFATGLFEPLGLKIVDGQIYVNGRDQITRLIDVNDDGEADFYECFFNTNTIYHDYHDFTFDLQADKAGNLFYVKGGNRVPWNLPYHSCVFKIAKDGKFEIFAKGFRAANGMGMGPNDELTVSDNQGHWTPACKINLVKKDGFYGYVAEPRVAENKETNAKHPASFDPPLCWIPMSADNSSGGEVWVTSDKWGALKGQMLHLSYGQSTLHEVAYEEVGGVPQGGTVRFPLKFEAGLMRGHFNPKDGQLYLCGIKGWQTNSANDGCLQRVRYTGKPVCMPVSYHVTAKGITLGFSAALDKASVNADSFAVEQWNYKWTSNYGSDDFSVADPAKKGRDKVEVTAAKLSADGKTVSIDIPGIRPVMQMAIKYKLKAADGSTVNQDFYNTINVVPK